MDAEATKSLRPDAGTMLQREPVDRYQTPATLPDRPRMAKSWCPERPNIDFEEFASRVQGFRLELLQIDQGAFRADGLQAYLGDALLGTVRLGRAFVQTWRLPARSVTIAVGTSRAPALWRGASFGPSDLLIGGAETEIELVSQPGFGVVGASFPDLEFRRAAALCGCSSAVDNIKCILVRLPKA